MPCSLFSSLRSWKVCPDCKDLEERLVTIEALETVAWIDRCGSGLYGLAIDGVMVGSREGAQAQALTDAGRKFVSIARKVRASTQRG